MIKPNILMFHRVKISETQKINKFYFERKIVCKINTVYTIIEKYLKQGYKFGSIEQCFYSQKYFHLSFDDGFKEHLQLAYLLKDKYNLQNNFMSFSINVGNSFFQKYSGMDIIYEIIEKKRVENLLIFLDLTINTKIDEIKQAIAKLKPNKLFELNKEFKTETKNLIDTFLSEKEIVELSKHFEILSHGITHRFLTYNQENSKEEILQSKKYLEQKIGKPIEIFCYPEGKNNKEVQDYCKNAGYKFALSIRHEENNKFCIGRKII